MTTITYYLRAAAGLATVLVVSTAFAVSTPGIDLWFLTAVAGFAGPFAGDVDSDGDCDIDDYLNAMLAEGPIDTGVAVTPGVNEQFDLNGDGSIDLDDRDIWLAEAAQIAGLSLPCKE